MILSSVSDARILELPRHLRDDGEIVVAEEATGVPFSIARMFTLQAPQGAERGQHAHRLCAQLMLCVHGAIDIVCDDGRDRSTLALARNNDALFVPPMIWTTVIFRKAESVLVVLCDQPYQEHDYIRDYPAFLSAKKSTAP
jgi:dTDP-4-dehydrorhamnose 3,5-epimerase-like enzyme